MECPGLCRSVGGAVEAALREWGIDVVGVRRFGSGALGLRTCVWSMEWPGRGGLVGCGFWGMGAEWVGESLSISVNLCQIPVTRGWSRCGKRQDPWGFCRFVVVALGKTWGERGWALSLSTAPLLACRGCLDRRGGIARSEVLAVTLVLSIAHCIASDHHGSTTRVHGWIE
jgi:hypothetical protein